MNRIPLADIDIKRAAEIRTHQGALLNLWRNPLSMCILLSGGDPILEKDGGLVWLSISHLPEEALLKAVFLGLDRSDGGLFALNLVDVSDHLTALENTEAVSLRSAFGVMSPAESSLVATARALFYWHNNTKFCGKCAAAMQISAAGWTRICSNCGHEVFPRTDPVAIMLATHGDRCLLGRSPNWPSGFMSCLAGFVEPGESVEQAACRELYEEAGIIARPENAQYLFSQPWPFPGSLMMGVVVEAETTDITLHDKELEEAHWVSRADMQSILSGMHAAYKAPLPQAIAYQIIAYWAAA